MNLATTSVSKMASDFAENELDLFRKAVSTATPVVHQPGFLQKISIFHQKRKLQSYWYPLLPEKALCRGRSLSAPLRIHSRQVIAGEVATAAWERRAGLGLTPTG